DPGPDRHRLRQVRRTIDMDDQKLRSVLPGNLDRFLDRRSRGRGQVGRRKDPIELCHRAPAGRVYPPHHLRCRWTRIAYSAPLHLAELRVIANTQPHGRVRANAGDTRSIRSAVLVVLGLIPLSALTATACRNTDSRSTPTEPARGDLAAESTPVSRMPL